MISVNKVEEDYHICQSCYANKYGEGKEIKQIAISYNGQHSSIFRLCHDCIDEMVKTLRR